ncbi:phospholipase [Altererythrobacter salegens]|uniref:Phospholipase D n=2 Tax=Croceibacterium salegens TaxID=1737568 RepID=A0A6I4SW14_9SPHN|nr:phospholipase [Croceibacterium salegens]
MQQAMLKARRRIMLIGWDFDTRIHLGRGRRWWQRAWNRGQPVRLGSFILWLRRTRPGLEIRILKWSLGFVKFFGRGTMLVDLVRWWPHRRIDFKFDTNHPLGCSHHQKIAVIDDRLAVCGGIDMTSARWDTRQHREDDPGRRTPRGKPYEPWHDATMMLEGEVAATLGELGRERWRRAGGKPLEPVECEGGSAWPDDFEAQFTDVEVGIARTRAAHGEVTEVHEIAELFASQIGRAKRFIYAESQYFASRVVAEAIGERLAGDDPPEVVVVHALQAEGFVEQEAMGAARTRLAHALQELDRHGRLHFYVPYTGETPIYCHAKLMIVDDTLLRIGSANFNNRSMGLDSECDVFIDCARAGNGHCGDAIRALRHSLLAEHLALEENEVGPLLEKHGSMATMIDALGTDRGRSLRKLHIEEITETEKGLADSELLDPETPEEMFEFLAARKRGLFRRPGLMSRAMARRRQRRRLGNR